MVRQARRARRKFGSCKPIIKHGRRYLEYSYPTPVEAFSKWPNLPARCYKIVAPEDAMYGEAWLSAASVAIKSGSWVPSQEEKRLTQRSLITFREYAVPWVEHRKKPDGSDLKQSSKQKYRESLDLYLLDYFGDKPMSEITPKDVQEWWDTFTPSRLDADREDRRYHIYKHLKAIMNSAATEPIDNAGRTLIASNPCHIKASRPKPKHKPIRPNNAQLTAFYAALPDWARITAMICDVTGLREGEALGLRLRDLDPDNLTIHVVQQSQRVPDGKGGYSTELTTLKTRSSERSVHITQPLANVLRDWTSTRKITNPNTLLITSPKTGKQIIPQTYRNAIAAARQKVPGLKDMWAHDLRKDGLSSMIEADATVSEVMRQGGHTSMSVASVYQTTGDHIHEVMRRLGETKPLASAPSVEQSDGEVLALADVLLSMSLDQRLTVLRSLSEDRRMSVLGVLPSDVRDEVLMRLFGGGE